MSSARKFSLSIVMLAVMCVAYAHVYSMVFGDTDHCGHDASEHTTCIESIQGYALDDSTFISHITTEGIPSTLAIIVIFLGLTAVSHALRVSVFTLPPP